MLYFQLCCWRTTGTGQGLRSVIGGFRSIMCVSVFQGSLLVNVIMIDGSEKRNCEGGFWASEFACFWKAQQARKRFKKTLDDLTLENLSASNVALDIRSFRSDLERKMSFTKPNNTSVCSVRSCASSMIRTLKNKKHFNWVQKQT